MFELEALIALGVKDLEPALIAEAKKLAVEAALIELPICISFGQKRLAYWQSQGPAMHWAKIGFWHLEIAGCEALLVYCQAQGNAAS